MKIRIEKDKLADAVAWVAKSLPARPTVPILAGLLIATDGDAVRLSTFDYETSAQLTLPAQVFEEGQALVSGKLLDAIAKQLPDQPVTITSDETKAELVCGSARFTLQALPVNDYPQLPHMPEATGTVTSDDFAKAVTQVVTAAGKDELLPVYTGVRLEIDGDTLSLLATDRYRMALRELPWKLNNKTGDGAAIVPARVLSETARSMASGERITLSLSGSSTGEGLIGFEGQGGGVTRQLTTRLLDGEFPKFRHLMDVRANVAVRIKTDELISSVTRVSIVAERNTALRMMIDDGQVSLDAATGDQAQASEAIEALVEVDAETDPPINAVGFNPHYLLDALKALDTPYVHFSFTAPSQPCLVRGLANIDADPENEYRHVIMLMRLPA
ncbi:MAG: DNA polymerase III subunit beta [Propionibacteriaceae bacterium]|jgi:DNA polymerase-3 subunit beta|nr:DNA polymerase III subunit beta [Propionibacteriaceae bacterium]